jgi:two-component system, response regulator PdtaR
MTSALLNMNGPEGSMPLEADLEAVGIHVVSHSDLRSKMVQDIVRSAPDLVVCYDPLPDDELFHTAQVISQTAPRPMVVFTSDTDVDKIERATQSGIHAYVINGYGLHRLRSVIHLAQARFRHEQLLQEELIDISSRFEERKLLDRAKGILMRARQISEDDAFQILRMASMHTNQRLGQVSKAVINSSRFAESVNRAGQLRMLSQRLVKLYALQLAGIDSATHSPLLADSVLRVDANLAILAKSLSKATFGDFLESITTSWIKLKAELKSTPDSGRMACVDALAEQVLLDADKLTSGLELAGSASPLHVINVSGRQRMLSQRVAKLALLASLADEKSRDAGLQALLDAQAQFEKSMDYLNDIPLSTKSIRADLDISHAHWMQLLAGLSDAPRASALALIAVSSEGLLDVFERLTDQYERSMQMLVG